MWNIVVAGGTGAHDGAGSISATLEFFWDYDVAGVDDGLCHIELGEIFHFSRLPIVSVAWQELIHMLAAR